MKIYVDISGQVDQKNLDSSLGCWRTDKLTRAVFLPTRTKKTVLKKYKGQIVNLIEKIHCILIYYCIKDILEGVDEIIICRDVNFRRVANLLPMLFSEHKNFRNINISPIDRYSEKSMGHNPALKAFRKRKYADEIITRDMIEKKILSFKIK